KRSPDAPSNPDGSRHSKPKIYPVLEGQPALVTGASSGIGSAIALGFAQAGADVVVNYSSDLEGAEEIAHQIEALGRRALVINADVSKEEDVEAMVAKAVQHFGTLHILVNNAGLQQDAPFDE